MFASLVLSVVPGPSFESAGAAPAEELAKSVLPVQLGVFSAPSQFESAGRTGLAYELHITGYRNIDLSLSQVEVFSVSEPGRSFLRLSGADLLQCLRRPGKAPELPDPEVLHGGDFVVVFLWITVDQDSPLPQSLAHRATFRLARPDGTEKEYVVEGAIVRVTPRTPVVLHPPLPAGRWLMANGPSMLGDHRLFLNAVDGATSNTQRFASDWMLLASDGRLVEGEQQENTSWHSYGVPVLAVADAVVVDVADGIPENVPLADERAVPNKRESVSGNYVVLRLGDDRFAFYGHLEPGSLCVRIGDSVRVGQELGRIGNSGNSDAPHLHFHVSDSPDPLSGEGVPFAFTSFTILDVLDVASWERMLAEAAPWEERADLQPDLRTNEMPIGELIVEFR